MSDSLRECSSTPSHKLETGEGMERNLIWWFYWGSVNNNLLLFQKQHGDGSLFLNEEGGIGIIPLVPKTKWWWKPILEWGRHGHHSFGWGDTFWAFFCALFYGVQVLRRTISEISSAGESSTWLGGRSFVLLEFVIVSIRGKGSWYGHFVGGCLILQMAGGVACQAKECLHYSCSFKHFYTLWLGFVCFPRFCWFLLDSLEGRFPSITFAAIVSLLYRYLEEGTKQTCGHVV